MSGEFKPKCLEETVLFKRFARPFATEASTKLANAFAQNLPDICNTAVERMKLMPAIHPEYTLHDDSHLLRVVELMAHVIPKEVLETVLNPVEIALLILAGFYHDTGMIPDKAEIERILQSPEYDIWRKNWLINFVGFSEAHRDLEMIGQPADTKGRSRFVVSEFDQAAFMAFLRETHAKRSASHVRNRLSSDDRVRIGTGHLVDSLALLCESHYWPSESITETNGFHYDKAIGTFPVNLTYLALILRLSDILDFDRERTPVELYRSINIRNSISLLEWEKHRQVEGWNIDKNAVRFECACERPEYERAIRHFLRLVDAELAAAHTAVCRFPAGFERYRLELPARTDDSRVRAKNNAYLYVDDLEIRLSREDIVRLLMTDKLYGQPSLAIRELLQNAWDALRHRQAVMTRDDGVTWTGGRVEFEHGVDENGKEFILCVDNGVGMDQKIVQDFLLRIGRSYYRSPEFERERLTFEKVKADFDPCARFGIGFMSLFMLGDRIIVHTRRYHGSSRGLGEPLIVEINGIDGLVVLRKGLSTQPAGTSVRIIGRQKPARFLTWTDRVQLIEALYAYALAGEYPIYAKCSIPEIKEELTIPSGIASPWHPFVEFKVEKKVIFEQDFSEVDPRMRGQIICGVPLSKEGTLTVANDEGGWYQSDDSSDASFSVRSAERFQIWSWEGRTCLDGVLVAGPQGRGRRHFGLVGTQYRNPINFGHDLFVLDVRGDLKPELTPNRAPPTDRGFAGDAGPSWRKLRRIATRAHGRLWEKVIMRFSEPENAAALWQLLSLHHVQCASLRRSFIWSHFWVPSLSETDSLFFRRFSEVSKIPFGVGTAKPFAHESSGYRVGVTPELDKWQDTNKFKVVSPALRKTVLSMATLTLRNDEPYLEFHPPEDPQEFGFTDLLLDRFSRSSIATLAFGSGLEDVLAAVTSERALNKRHPVAQYLLSNQENASDDPVFHFLHTLACAMVEEGVIECLSSGDFSNRKVNFHFCGLGFAYKNVDPSALDEKYKPPYRCWTADKGFTEITGALLTRLAEIQETDWMRREEPRYI